MKRTPLKRKTPLKRSKKPLKRTALHRGKPMLKRTPLKQSSTAKHKLARKKLYRKRKLAYLKGKYNCEACGELFWQDHEHGLLDLHHKAMRKGQSPNASGEMEDNYTNPETFMAVCRPCHMWIHENPKEARQKGWLAE